MLRNSFAFTLSLGLIFSVCSHAATPSAQVKPEDLKKEFSQILKEKKSLKSFYERISKKFGDKAISPLLSIAKNESESDELRWASLFGLAKLTGSSAVGVFKGFMNHKSWVLRDAAIKSSIAACQVADESIANACTKAIASDLALRLKDTSLIVRTSAVDAISTLKLKEHSASLMGSLSDPINFHKGQPLWIHDHTLSAIEKLELNALAPQLADYLAVQKNEKLQLRVIQALEKLTGRVHAGKNIQEQVYLWKRNTTSEKSF